MSQKAEPRQMRVLQLGPYPPPYGGIQTNLVAIREFLQDRGIPCDVINLTRYRQADGGGVYYPRSALGVLRLLLRLRSPIVHLHIGGNVTSRLLGLCLCCCVIPGSRTVLSFHSGGYPCSPAGRRARRWSLRGLLFRRFNRVIAVNQEIAELFGKYGLEPNQVRLIPPSSSPADVAGTVLPERLESFFAAHTPVLLTVGLLEPEYDLSLQTKVLGAVRRLHPDAGLVIIGSGSLEGRLRREIQSMQYAGHILLCGDVPHPATLAAIARCDLFLRTSHYDGDSLAVREALHFGAPVIASDNGMRPRGVVLTPPRDEDGLLRAIEACLAGAKTRGTTGHVHSNEDNLKPVLDLYQELMTRE